MDVYIASTLANADRVRALGHKLRTAHVTVTYDWTAHNNGVPYIPDDQPDLKRKIAVKELLGVIHAKCLLIIMPGERGTHFEFGLAYALRKPIVLLLDQHDGRSPSFHFLDNIVRCFTEEEALTAVFEFLVGKRSLPDKHTMDRLSTIEALFENPDLS